MKDEFFYAPSQRRGIIFLLLLIIGYFTYLIKKNQSEQQLEPIKFLEDVPVFPSKNANKNIHLPIKKNPNHWSKNDWKSLGFSEKQILIIENYKTSVKKFKSKNELFRCYAFSEENKKMLDTIVQFPVINKINQNLKSFLFLGSTKEPDFRLNKIFDTVYYQKIKNRFQYYIKPNQKTIQILKNLKTEKIYSSDTVTINSKSLKMIVSKKKHKKNFSKTTPQAFVVAINVSDTTSFKKIKGIGSKRAVQILKYRNLLGRFISVNQIKEVYSINDSLFESIKDFLIIKDSTLKQININLCSIKDLNRHPYIKWNIANSIINYRNQHGLYNSLDELLKIHIIDQKIYFKIVPYLTIK